MATIHTVNIGETWGSISDLYGVNVLVLMAINANRKGRDANHPRYAWAETYSQTGYALYSGMTVRIPENKKRKKIDPMIFTRETKTNSNRNAVTTVKTTAAKPKFEIGYFSVTQRWSNLLSVNQNTVDYRPINNKSKPVNSVLDNFGQAFDNIDSNPARVALLTNPFTANAHIMTLMVSPKSATVVEGEIPVISAVNLDLSAFYAGGTGTINIFNGQAFVGAGGALGGNTSKKELDPMPDFAASLTLIPYKYLVDKKTGKFSRKSAAKGADDIIGGASSGGSITYRGVMVGVDYNYPGLDSAEAKAEAKISYKLGLSARGVGADISAGTSFSEAVGTPLWPSTDPKQ